MSVADFETDGLPALRESTKLAVASIVDEAKATRGRLRLQDALLVLIFERWDRGIINEAERDYLVKRLYS